MTSIIFVHGTGGRSREYVRTFEQIEAALHERRSDIKLYQCLWGDDYGTKLNAGGVSIPSYDLTGGEYKTLDSKDSHLLLWEDLYRDPLYEICLLSLKPTTQGFSTPGKLSPSEEFQNKVNNLDIAAASRLKDEIGIAGITDVFTRSHKTITESRQFSRLLENVSSPLEEYYSAIARAFTAQSIYILKEEGRYAAILYSPDLRDRVADAIYRELTQDIEARGIVGDWLKEQIYRSFINWGNKRLQRQRGALTDATYPFAGDILLYQAKGEKIREFIHRRIEQVDPPVVLLAHSLGGIASVDLLAEKDLSVELLITVGSQAPFLYEIGALKCLSYGEPLPKFFPKWVNIYDLRDILSYVGNYKGLFPDRVSDIPVDNGQPFPEAHSAYWSNSEVWEKIVKELP